MEGYEVKRFWAIEDRGYNEEAGWFALYKLRSAPYVLIEPLMGWALIKRQGQEEIVGLCASTTVYPADDPPEGVHFVTYYQRGSSTAEQADEIFNTVAALGQAWEQEYVAQQESQRGHSTENRVRGMASSRPLSGQNLRVLQESTASR